MSATEEKPATGGASYEVGFDDLTEELPPTSLEVTGELPEWLSGGLVRVTPAQKDFGARSVSHWFDGAAMLHRFGISAGEVVYSNRFLNTGFRRDALASGGKSIQGFATDPCRTLFQRVQSVFRQPAADNTNVNLSRLGDEHIAMTETPLAICFDPETLATTGADTAAGALGQVTTAHPHHDPLRGELVNFTVQMGPKSRYRVYGRGGSNAEPREIATMPTQEPAYMHSFALTERYALLIENPLVVQPVRLIVGMTLKAESFISQYCWKPELGLRITALDRETGEVAGRWKCAPGFVFHTINAFDRDSEIVLDVCLYEDASIIDALTTERLLDDDATFQDTSAPRATRFELPLNGDEAISAVISDEIDFELPRINYRAHNARPYKYAYGNAASGAPFIKDIVKLDVETGEHLSWGAADHWAGEPVFVPAPDAQAEDDGVLLSVVLDAAAQRSYLLVLDARDLSEIARAQAPHTVPFGFHGQFFSS